MVVDNILNYVYFGTGLLALLLFLFVSYYLGKEKPEVIKSRMFLDYKLFKISIYILTIGLILLVIGHFGEIFDSHHLHTIGEALHDLAMLVFALILFLVIRPRKFK